MATGATGMQGPQGARGPTGPNGSSGNTGIQGVQGPDGLKGSRGATGPTGIQAPPITCQSFYGSSADETTAGTVWRLLPDSSGSGSISSTTGATSTYFSVPAGYYMIRAYGSSCLDAGLSYITMRLVTIPGGTPTAGGVLLTGSIAETGISYIFDTYTFTSNTLVGIFHTTANNGVVPLSTVGPNVGITFIRLQ